MEVIKQSIADVLLIKPKVYGDQRGWFAETWQQQRYQDAGIEQDFIQDNMAHSLANVLRGLHIQNPYGQGKLVQVYVGEVFDVAVDVRKGSPTFGQWVGVLLSEDNKSQLWVPPGFAHGYYVTSEQAVFGYKCTDMYHPETQFSVRWDDPAIGIDWPLNGEPVLADKDREAPLLADIDTALLPAIGKEVLSRKS